MALNDFETTPDPSEETAEEQENGKVTTVNVEELLAAQEAMSKAIDATNDAAANVGYQLGILSEKSRILQIIELVSKSTDKEGVTNLMSVLTDLINRDEEEIEEGDVNVNGDV